MVTVDAVRMRHRVPATANMLSTLYDRGNLVLSTAVRLGGARLAGAFLPPHRSVPPARRSDVLQYTVPDQFRPTLTLTATRTNVWMPQQFLRPGNRASVPTAPRRVRHAMSEMLKQMTLSSTDKNATSRGGSR